MCMLWVEWVIPYLSCSRNLAQQRSPRSNWIRSPRLRGFFFAALFCSAGTSVGHFGAVPHGSEWAGLTTSQTSAFELLLLRKVRTLSCRIGVLWKASMADWVRLTFMFERLRTVGALSRPVTAREARSGARPGVSACEGQPLMTLRERYRSA